MAEFAIPFTHPALPGGRGPGVGRQLPAQHPPQERGSLLGPHPAAVQPLPGVDRRARSAGLQPPTFRNFKLIPYVLGRGQPDRRDAGRDRSRSAMPAVDVKYSLTPSLTLDGTYRTDFAQVEVDDQQVNLDRFNLFFPEKRPFFLENAGFFSVGNPGEVDLFFSRRIGLNSAGEAIPIIGGGRVSGKVGLWNVGLLDMQTEGRQDLDARRNNFGVVRVSRELPNRSAVGGIFVNRAGFGDLARDDDYNRTYAVDGKWGIGQQLGGVGLRRQDRDAGRREQRLRLQPARAHPLPEVGSRRRVPGGRRRASTPKSAS